MTCTILVITGLLIATRCMCLQAPLSLPQQQQPQKNSSESVRRYTPCTSVLKSICDLSAIGNLERVNSLYCWTGISAVACAGGLSWKKLYRTYFLLALNFIRRRLGRGILVWCSVCCWGLQGKKKVSLSSGTEYQNYWTSIKESETFLLTRSIS